MFLKTSTMRTYMQFRMSEGAAAAGSAHAAPHSSTEMSSATMKEKLATYKQWLQEGLIDQKAYDEAVSHLLKQ